MVVSVLVVSVLAMIGITSATMAYRELSIFTVSTESHRAFYSADSAIECALYHDLHSRVFLPSSSQQSINCGGETVRIERGDFLGRFYRTQFTVNFPRPNSSTIKDCAVVEIIKAYSTGGSKPLIFTFIDSRGRTNCSSKIDFFGLERWLRTSYQHQSTEIF